MGFRNRQYLRRWHKIRIQRNIIKFEPVSGTRGDDPVKPRIRVDIYVKGAASALVSLSQLVHIQAGITEQQGRPIIKGQRVVVVY